VVNEAVVPSYILIFIMVDSSSINKFTNNYCRQTVAHDKVIIIYVHQFHSLLCLSVHSKLLQTV